MRLIGAFDPILEFATLGRQKARYRIEAVCRSSTEIWYVVHRLTDCEFVAAHNVLDYSVRAWALPCAHILQNDSARTALSSTQYRELS
jgi:hypothetical protein